MDAPLDLIVSQIADACKDLVTALERGETLAALNLRRAARLPVVAGLHQALQRPFLLLTDRPDRALSLHDELRLWAPQARRLLFPEPTPLFYEKQAWAETTRRERLTVLNALAEYHRPEAASERLGPPPLIIASARALMTRTLSRREFLKVTRTLRPGQRYSLDQLSRTWLSLGYTLVNTVVAPGQFSHRGGILDIWPSVADLPYRIEFFGDEIDTLRLFDPTTQRTLKSQEHLRVTPAREFILPAEDNAPSDEICEFHIPLLHPLASSLLDFLPRQSLIFIDDLQALQDTITEVEEQAVKLREDLLAQGLLSPDYPIPYLTWNEIADALTRLQTLELGGVAAEIETPSAEASTLACRFTAGPRFGGRLKPFIEHLRECLQKGERTIIVSRQYARLSDLWRQQHPYPLPSEPQFVEGSLSEGFTFLTSTATPLHLFTDGEIFGWRKPEPRQRARLVAESPEAAYADLQPGDLVVHVDHGIGIFLGLVRRTLEGVEREYLCLEYADGAQLFIPVYQADRITRYIGADNRPPALSHLGSHEWHNTKNQVKDAVQEVAKELLELYAKRSLARGHAFAPDTQWQQELEASFPYVETEDQVRVLKEVKQDMEAPRPMDRLICGDVGYGKTEVALRAAFKAVMDGKQVAMLVPTTVLAQQHYQTFRQRLAAFPVEVEMLSRFRTPQEQRDILQRLARGAIDIVIGTHRLLSSDVQFKDLGLLIIDEEQRFGVTHKETLKKMRTEVDVLTLTATPIPRTLFMALSGIRDISTINTPPEERLPIVTYVGPYSPRLVRQAILRELERGGQVFFVHNRVQTIPAMRRHLEQLVPEARILVAHGQMAEAELSEAMQRFSNGEVDVLLSTSIIESGLDIPNANTLIVDRADTFGLAQLYQLRGRVGRGAQRAYAYFFRHARRPPTIEGQERLETIAENTQLGAGFSIAMRDLEIRGAGEILGTRQHGHIAAVGFHLYTRLLADAVRRLSPQPPLSAREEQPLPPATPVHVDLPLPIGLPIDYIPDKNLRLYLYRRMADIRSLSQLEALAEEFYDRFGPPPEQVNNLFYQLKVKLLAERAGLISVSSENHQLALRFPEAEVPQNLPELGPEVRVGKSAIWIPYDYLPNWQQVLLEVLDKLQRVEVSR